MYSLSGVGEESVFLGTDASVVVDPSSVPGCKTNNIYFTDVTRTLSDEIFVGADIGIFKTRDETFSTIYPLEIRHTRVGTPIWLTPNSW